MLGEGATHLTTATGRDDGGPREHLAVGDLEQAPGSSTPTTPHPLPTHPPPLAPGPGHGCLARAVVQLRLQDVPGRQLLPMGGGHGQLRLRITLCGPGGPGAGVTIQKIQ